MRGLNLYSDGWESHILQLKCTYIYVAIRIYIYMIPTSNIPSFNYMPA